MEGYPIYTRLIFIIGFTCVSAEVILPLDLSEPEEPICASHNGLCHLAYRYVVNDNLGHVLDSPMCRCPGDVTCPVGWEDQRNSITKTFKNAGQEMEVKISYCRLHQPGNKCRFNHPAVLVRSLGPFLFEIEGEFQCRCVRPLFAHRSWSAEGKDYIEYSCGKRRCAKNASNRVDSRSKVCGRITYRGPNNFQHEFFCRCTRYQECIPAPGVMPDVTRPQLNVQCRQVVTQKKK